MAEEVRRSANLLVDMLLVPGVFASVAAKPAAAGAQRTVPGVLTALGSASIGALAGLLAPSPANRNG